jgi:hypothetical protein
MFSYYDMGKERKYFTSTVEMFKPDEYGRPINSRLLQTSLANGVFNRGNILPIVTRKYYF